MRTLERRLTGKFRLGPERPELAEGGLDPLCRTLLLLRECFSTVELCGLHRCRSTTTLEVRMSSLLHTLYVYWDSGHNPALHNPSNPAAFLFSWRGQGGNRKSQSCIFETWQ
jgi:hypothetical protein